MAREISAAKWAHVACEGLTLCRLNLCVHITVHSIPVSVFTIQCH